MSQMDLYLTQAHSARHRAMYAGIALGALVGAILEGFGVKVEFAFLMCVVTVGGVEAFEALFYEEPSRREKRAVAAFPIRRSILKVPLAVAGLWVISLLDFPRREAFAAEGRLERASANPDDPESIDGARRVLAYATAARVRIAPAVLRRTGQKFVVASANDPAAWKAATAFIDYQSAVEMPPYNRSDFYPFNSNAQGPKFTYYIVGGIRGEAHPQFAISIKQVPIGSSARIEQIGAPVRQEVATGPARLLASGGALALDGYYLRSILLVDVTVYYSGGPVILENVGFINCKFRISNLSPGRDLGTQILASSSVDFRFSPRSS